MNSTGAISLCTQRQALRRLMLAQRLVIAHQLGPASSVNNGYPRSMTMRFLTRRPELAIELVIGVSTLLMAK